MGKKVLFSTLGSTNYTEVYYCLGDNCGKLTKYVQRSIIEYNCLDWGKEDRIYIMLTEDARQKNWDSLKEELSELDLQVPIYDIDIPTGFTEDEIWQIFKIIYDLIEEKDQIIFDITHGFRSLPLMSLAIINYTSVLKNTDVTNIFYGAFEALGPAYKVKEMPDEKRKAPLIDFKKFIYLNQWAIAIQNFDKMGDTTLLQSLSTSEIKDLFIQGKQEESAKLRSIIKNLNGYAQNIRTVRGKSLVQFDLTKFKETELDFLPIFKPLYDRLRKKVGQYSVRVDDDIISNGLSAALWSFAHGHIQQGITLFREMIITKYVLKFHGEEYIDNRDKRGDVEEIINNAKEKRDKLKDKHEDVDGIESYDLDAFSSIRELRNDINHGGFREDAAKVQKFHTVEATLSKYIQAMSR